MSEGDTRRWSLRSAGAEICNNNVPTAMLLQWANKGLIKPGSQLSADGKTWVPAESLPELGMSWYILAPGRPPYGPVTRVAAELFIAKGHFPQDATLSQDPGEQPVSSELPLPLDPVPDAHAQEVEELREKLVLLERELRLKDRRIDELRQEAEARQPELNVEGVPDAEALAAELEGLRLEHAHLKRSAQEAAEAAAGREHELRQRIHTLEVAVETAQHAPAGESAQPPDAALFNILAGEAEWLRKCQDEEAKLLEHLRELAHRRLGHFSDRLLEIRRLAGDSPEQMRANARQGIAPVASFAASPPIRRETADRVAALEQELTAARERESGLQRRLVAQEGQAAELRARVAQAERQTLDSLKLDASLQETRKALKQEQDAREEEHRENAHIQEQLLRRIEELERLFPAEGVQAPPSTQTETPEPQLSAKQQAFGWLRRH